MSRRFWNIEFWKSVKSMFDQGQIVMLTLMDGREVKMVHPDKFSGVIVSYEDVTGSEYWTLVSEIEFIN